PPPPPPRIYSSTSFSRHFLQGFFHIFILSADLKSIVPSSLLFLFLFLCILCFSSLTLVFNYGFFNIFSLLPLLYPLVFFSFFVFFFFILLLLLLFLTFF
ncbi:hypothetical protein OTU49_015275, partial [Cherax quadricarinatus]